VCTNLFYNESYVINIVKNKHASISLLKGGKKKSLFIFYEKRLDNVDDKTQVFARKLSVLLQHLTLEGYTKLVKEDEFTKEECDNHIRRLIRAQIFSGDNERWFKHELMQEYVRDENMGGELMKIYHEYAAIFFEERYKNAVEKGEGVDFSIALGCAYHFHYAGLHEQSYSYNASLADFSLDTGSLDVAEACYGRAMEDATELGDEEGIAIQRGNLARIYRIGGRVDDALNTYQELYEYFKENGDKENEATALHQIGMIHQDKGEYEKALENYDKSLEISEEIGDKRGIAATLHQIGMIHQDKGEYEKALENYDKSLEISEEIGNKRGIAYTLGQIAIIHYLMGESDKALKNYERTLGISNELGDRSSIACALHQIGMIHQDKGEYEKALENYTKSLEISEEIGDKFAIATSLGQIGTIEHRQKRYHEAILMLAKAASLYNELESPYFETAMKNLASIKEEIGEDKFNEILQELDK